MFDGRLPPMPHLLACARLVPDFRVDRRRRHILAEIIFIAVAAQMCGMASFYEMADFGRAREAWLRGNGLELPGGIPSHDTFRRVLSILDPAALRRCLAAFLEKFRPCLAGDVAALDGKSLRRACAAGGRTPCVVSAWAVAARMAFGEQLVPEKTNEITALPKLIARLPIRGAVVTVDAAGCQREVARAVIEAGADYVLALKGNQGTMEEEMGELLRDVAAREPRGHASSADKGHGRLETRRIWTAADLGWFADRGKWRRLRSARPRGVRADGGGEDERGAAPLHKLAGRAGREDARIRPRALGRRELAALGHGRPGRGGPVEGAVAERPRQPRGHAPRRGQQADELR